MPAVPSGTRDFVCRAQPPEIVSKSTTTSIFGNRDENEEPPLDVVPAGETSCWQSVSHRKCFSNFQIYRIRTTHESLSPTMNCVSGIVLNIRRNSLDPELLEMVRSFTLFYIAFYLPHDLDAPVANAPTPTSDSKSLLPPPLVSNDVKSPPVPNNASKRSNARKNQYGDEVYEWTLSG